MTVDSSQTFSEFFSMLCEEESGSFFVPANPIVILAQKEGEL